jgi:hypothetical protein
MKKISLGLVLIVAVGKTIAAEGETNTYQYTGQPVDMCVSVRLEAAHFHIYDPPFKAKGVFAKMEDAKCITPEELVESIKSETTQEWVDYNYAPGKSHVVSSKAFEKRSKLDKNTNYFELVHKLSFLYNGTPTAIIKYYFIDEGKRTILASMVVQKRDGRWYRTSIAGLDHLEAVVCRLKSKNLAMLYSSTVANDANEYMKMVRNSVKEQQNVLNSEKLFDELIKASKKESLDEYLSLSDKSNP